MDITIIGASAAGLATAKLLRDKGFAPVLLERADDVGARWAGHYDRLHLHTSKAYSGLPGMAFPAETPRYAARDQVVDYLRAYARRFDLRPEFGVQVNRLTRNGAWQIDSSKGPRRADIVVLATGANNLPRRIDRPGLDSFAGPVIHSSEYRNGSPFRGQRVLVIGFGNSACEIAIDLHEHGEMPALAVRSPVNVVPRDLLGIPILSISRRMRILPPAVADRLNAPLLRLVLGDIRKLGLQKAPYGPITQVVEHRKIPLLDIGTIRLMRQGFIKAYPDIARIDGPMVHFTHGRHAEFDAIIMATGYQTGIDRLVDLPPERIADMSDEIGHRRMEGDDNLYFCGGFVSRRGMLNEIGTEATEIARRIAAISPG